MTGHTVPVFIGVDVGTSGIRAIAAGFEGTLMAGAERPIATDRRPAASLHEQDPEEWWREVCVALNQTLQHLSQEKPRHEVQGIAVTSTSGTLIVAGESGQPLRPAILYDDRRSAEVCQELEGMNPGASFRIDPSYSLAKALWVRKEEPEIWAKTRYLLHPADWLTGKLTGEFGLSDHSNSLKLGYDPETRRWGSAVAAARLPAEFLPRVLRPGQRAGTISSPASQQTGLAPGIPVLAGATDGITSLVASGASQPGHANTTLGTTLVWKALSREKPPAANGIYSHLHPTGLWAPGAASNTGPGCVQRKGHSVKPAELDRLAQAVMPTPVLCYVLPGKGERFPFLNNQAVTFREGEPRNDLEWYAAQLQAIAFAERWGYEVLEEQGVTIGEVVFSAGAAAASPVLSGLRANVLKRAVSRCHHPTAAVGAAILAAAGTQYGGDTAGAIMAMTLPAETHTPVPEQATKYDELYGRFRAACARRGYGS